MSSATLQALLEAAFQAWPARLKATAWAYFRDPDLVDEVIQEAYVSVVRAAPPCHTPQEALAYWKAAIRSRSIDRLRRGWRQVVLDEQTVATAARTTTCTTASTEAQYIKRETADRRALALHAALATLPPKQRQAVDLHAFQGMSYEQIAESLGVPRSTPYRRFQSACERLTAILRRSHPDLWPDPQPFAGGGGGAKTHARPQRQSPLFVQ